LSPLYLNISLQHYTLRVSWKVSKAHESQTAGCRRSGALALHPRMIDDSDQRKTVTWIMF